MDDEVELRTALEENGNKKRRMRGVILAFVVALLTIGGASTLIAVLVQEGAETSSPKKGRSATCEESILSAVDVNTCSNLNCSFDTSNCEVPCPFDYLTDKSGCPASCECADEGLYQGDIQFDSSEIMDLAERYGYIAPEHDFDMFYDSLEKSPRLWTSYFADGRYRIPYNLSQEIEMAGDLTNVLTKAMSLIANETCVDFVRRTDEEHYVLFTDDERSCSSFEGMVISESPQRISLTQHCRDLSNVAHELMHVLGFSHEHVRPDRDAFLDIMWDNIEKGREREFRKLQGRRAVLRIPYDVDSRLHYSSDAFAVNADQPSMVIRGTGEKIIYNPNDEFSHKDIFRINTAYKCFKEVYPAVWTDWDTWSSCDETCGEGERHRYRKCIDTEGRYTVGCAGSPHEFEKCDTAIQCPDVDHWLSWGPWGACVGTCRNGHRVSERKCSTEGKCGHWSKKIDNNCDPCASRPRARIEELSSWGQWSSCSSSCDGQRIRNKMCEGICYNAEKQSEPCNTGVCFEGQVLGVWGEWGICNDQCMQERSRRCRDAENHPVPACHRSSKTYEHESRSCGPDKCDAHRRGEWGPWSVCSSLCNGERKRRKKCLSVHCSNAFEQVEACNAGACTARNARSGGQDMFENVEVPVSGDLCAGVHAKWIFGDFDGDGQTDIMCYDMKGEYSVGNINEDGSINQISSGRQLNGCGGGEKYVGDFNGDGKEDILCRVRTAKKLVVKIMSDNGVFNDAEVDGGRFCTGPWDHLIVMDVNKDGATDLLCHFADKHIEVLMNERAG